VAEIDDLRKKSAKPDAFVLSIITRLTARNSMLNGGWIDASAVPRCAVGGERVVA